MISLLLLILTITISAIVVRIATIALEITGMTEEQAHFQALSSFTGVGFTTREAEYVINHPQRRKIIRILIRIGSAGVITSVATLAGTLVSSPKLVTSFFSDSKLSWLPLNGTQLTFLLILLPFLCFYLLLKRPAVARLLKEMISVWLLKEKIVKPAEVEELTFYSSGYGVARIDITDDNPLAGLRIKDTHLDEKEVTVLSIERPRENVVYPSGLARIEVGDSIFCFGPLDAIRSNCTCPKAREERDVIIQDGMLEIGSQAPDFELKDQNNKLFSLSDHIYKNTLILFFYPKDNSYICSEMVKSYSSKAEELAELNIIPVGVNPSSVECHKGFCELVDSSIPILSDDKKEVCAQYKTLALGGLLVDRSVYVINKSGKIIFAKRGNPSIKDVIAAARED